MSAIDGFAKVSFVSPWKQCGPAQDGKSLQCRSEIVFLRNQRRTCCRAQCAEGNEEYFVMASALMHANLGTTVLDNFVM